MTRYLLVPGMNHGGWWYDPLVDALARHGHRADAITPAGLEAVPDLERRITLDTHIDQIVATLDAADGPAVLVGHSYGGLPIVAAADRRPDSVRAVVLLDAFLPEDGDSAWSLTNEEEREWIVADSRQDGDTVQPLPFFDDRARPHPMGTLFQSVTLTGAWRQVDRIIHVEATRWPGETPIQLSIDRARVDPQIECRVWDTRHNVMHDGPGRVLDLLLELAG